MSYFLVPVTICETVLVSYPVDPYDGGFEQAATIAHDDVELYEHFPAALSREVHEAHVEAWWEVETDSDAILSAYESSRIGRQALARGLMALMIQ